MEKIWSIDRTTEDGLCTSCGICAAVCPVSCIRFERRNETYLPVIDYDKCIQCGKCLRICPGYSYTYDAKMEKEPVCFSVQAKDKRLLKHASSGGLVTAMVRKLLWGGQYNTAFLVLDYNYTTLQLLKKSNAQGTFRSIISLQINPYERE